ERLTQQNETPRPTPRAPAHKTQNLSAPQAPKTVNPGAPGASTMQGGVLSVGGGYQLLEQIGVGGFGEVWRAEAPGGIQVAVKVIFRPGDNQEAVERELEALELMKGLRHQCLLQIQAYWPLRDRILIVMELADGSLRHRLRACVQA